MERKKRSQLSLVQEVKHSLAQEIVGTLTERKLNQTKAAELLETQQPRVSDLFQFRLEKFSIDMLISWLEKLDRPINLNTQPRIASHEHAAAGDPIRLLLIEDNDDDVELLLETLAGTRGLTIEATRARALKEGIAKFSDTRFDAILLDLGLPDSQGVETYKLARAGTSATVPIIVLTGLFDPELPAEMVAMGAENFLNKGHPRIGYHLARTLFNAMARTAKN